MRARGVARALAFLAALALAAPRGARACSVCLAGDPLFSTHGTSAQEVGSFSLYFELRVLGKTSGIPTTGEALAARVAPPSTPTLRTASPRRARAAKRQRNEAAALLPRHAGHGHAPPPADAGKGSSRAADAAAAGSDSARRALLEGEEELRTTQLDLYASWTPLDRLTLTLDVPFVANRITEEIGDDRTRATLAGLGDLSLSSSYVLWRNRDVLPSTWLEGRLFVKAPTGRDESKVEGVRDPHLQPGTGSWDFGAGLAGVHRLSWGSLYASLLYRENTQGSLDYTYGDVFLANVAVEVPVGHALGRSEWSWLTAGLELNFRYAGYDQADGERVRNTGGSILYATPSLRFRLPWSVRGGPLSVRGAVQIPLTQSWLHGRQEEDAVWSLGLLVPF